jgi:hypothetical protein
MIHNKEKCFIYKCFVTFSRVQMTKQTVTLATFYTSCCQSSVQRMEAARNATSINNAQSVERLSRYRDCDCSRANGNQQTKDHLRQAYTLTTDDSREQVQQERDVCAVHRLIRLIVS